MDGPEVWGWEQQPEIEIVQNKYIHWILKLKRYVCTYILVEETKRNSLWHEAAK